MLVTECGIIDRIKQEKIKNKKVVGGCKFCPFMRSLNLDGILKALQNPSPDQIVKIDKKF
jgi:quinolinate synthase